MWDCQINAEVTVAYSVTTPFGSLAVVVMAVVLGFIFGQEPSVT